jgi:hypothetical protein
MDEDVLDNTESLKKDNKNFLQKIWRFIRDLINAISGALPFVMFQICT